VHLRSSAVNPAFFGFVSDFGFFCPVSFKFDHIFAALLAICVVTAFVLPSRYANRAHLEVAVLFAPVSMPAGAIARRAHDSLSPDRTADNRPDQDIRRENEELREQLARMTEQLKDLQARNDERSKIGPLREFCTPFAVIGGDPGARESLQIRASSLQGLSDGMAALYTFGLAGRVQRAGIAGAQVQLVTDTGFTVRVSARRIQSANGEIVAIPRQRFLRVVEGIGRNRMIIPRVTMEQVDAAGLRPGDVLVLDDPDWPMILKGTQIGQITSIEKSKTHPGFADIHAEPPQVLLRLGEVLVLTKGE
jgi:cell shape-determining protein MreC